MADQIRISPEQMRGRASEYRAQADTMQGVITKMRTLLTQLQSEWEGESSRAYADRYTELEKGFIKAQELITEIAASLDATARIMEDADAQIGAQYKG